MHAVLQTVIGTSDQATKQTDRKPNSEGSVAHAEAPGSWREEEEAAGRGRVSEIRREQQLVGTKMGAAEAGGQAVNRDTSGAIEEGVKGLLAGSSDVDGADVGARTPPQSLGDKWEGVEGGDIARLTPHTEGLKARDDAAGIGFGVVREGAREEVWVDMWSCLVDVLEVCTASFQLSVNFRTTRRRCLRNVRVLFGGDSSLHDNIREAVSGSNYCAPGWSALTFLAAAVDVLICGLASVVCINRQKGTESDRNV